jgi:hypothetical protein
VGFIFILLCACDFLLSDLRIFLRFVLAGLDFSHRFSTRFWSRGLFQPPTASVLFSLSIDSFSSLLATIGSHAERVGWDFPSREQVRWSVRFPGWMFGSAGQIPVALVLLGGEPQPVFIHRVPVFSFKRRRLDFVFCSHRRSMSFPTTKRAKSILFPTVCSGLCAASVFPSQGPLPMRQWCFPPVPLDELIMVRVLQS